MVALRVARQMQERRKPYRLVTARDVVHLETTIAVGLSCYFQ